MIEDTITYPAHEETIRFPKVERLLRVQVAVHRCGSTPFGRV